MAMCLHPGGAPVETYILEVVDGSNPAYRLVKEFSGQDVEGSVDGLQLGPVTFLSQLARKVATGLLATKSPTVYNFCS